MAIAYDNVASGGSSFSFTIGSGQNRLLVACVASEGASNVDSITYNSVAMTKLTEVDPGAAGTIAYFYMLEANLPATGAYTLTASVSGSPTYVLMGAISLSGVAQQAPEASNSKTQTSAGQTVTLNVTTITNGAWVIDGVMSGDGGTFTAQGTNQTERYDTSAGATVKIAGSTRPVTTAGEITLQWLDSDGSPFRQGIIGAAFAPASEGTNVTVTPSVLSSMANLQSILIDVINFPAYMYNIFKANLFRGYVDLLNSGSHQIKAALLNNSYTFSSDHKFFSSISGYEITGTGYTSGGMIINNFSVTQDDNFEFAKFDADDISWSNSSITARYIVVYDDTLITKDLIMCIDLLSDYTSNQESFAVQWNSNGLFYIK